MLSALISLVSLRDRLPIAAHYLRGRGLEARHLLARRLPQVVLLLRGAHVGRQPLNVGRVDLLLQRDHGALGLWRSHGESCGIDIGGVLCE